MRHRPLSPAEVGEMHRLRGQGKTLVQIGEQLDRPTSTVSRALRMQPCDFDQRPRYIYSQAALTERRMEIKAFRDAMIAGEVTLADVLLGEEVHPLVAAISLVDVVLMARTESRRRNAASMESLGREAVFDGVNLLVRAGRASEATRRWVVEHATHQPRRAARVAA